LSLVFLPLVFLQLGCVGEKWSYLEEYDDAYATSVDEVREMENLEKLEAYHSAHPEEVKSNRKRFTISPKLKETLLYIGGGILELALDVVLVYLLYF